MGGIIDFLASPEMIGLWLTEPSSFVRNGGSPGLANMAPETLSGSSSPAQWSRSWPRLPA